MKKRQVICVSLALVMLLAFLPSVGASGPALSLDKSAYSPSSAIIVTVTGVTPQMVDDKAFVAIYKAGAPNAQYEPGTYQYPKNNPSVLFFAAPLAQGSYEMRLFSQDFDTRPVTADEVFVTKAGFTVGGGDGDNGGNGGNNSKQITITTAAKLPDATVGKSYSVSFATSDSLYRWVRAESSLTGLFGAGLSFNPGGLTGKPSISGTPTKAGTIKVKFSPTNAPTATSRAPGAVVKEFTLTIKHARAAAVAPKISRQPKGKTIRRNGKHVLTVTSKPVASAKISFQWFRSNKKNGKFKKVSGKAGKKAVYLAPSKKRGTTWYRCTVTNTDSNAKKKKTSRNSKTVKVTVR